MSVVVPKILEEVFEEMDDSSDTVRVSMTVQQIIAMINLLKEIKDKITREMAVLSSELETATDTRREAITAQLENGRHELAKGDLYLAEYNAMLEENIEKIRAHVRGMAIADIVHKSVMRHLHSQIGCRKAQDGTVSLPDDE
jgi:hypothetical protein